MFSSTLLRSIFGAFTACLTVPLVNISTISSDTDTATFSCASTVDAPKCGVTTIFSCAIKGESIGGSCSKTSNAALLINPSSKAFTRALSSMIPPLATLIICKLDFAF